MPAEPTDGSAALCAGTTHQDAGVIGAYAPASCRGREIGTVLEPRPREQSVEDVATGHVECILEVNRGLAFHTGVAVGVGGQTVFNRFGEHRVERRQHRGHECGAHRVVVFAREESVRHVQAENGECLVSGFAKLRRQNARVGQRVTVDLTGKGRGNLAGNASRITGGQLRVVLVDVKRATEGLLRGHGRIGEFG